MRHSMSRSRVVIGSALAVVFAMTVGMGVVAATPSGGPATVDVQLLSINDFHGNLEPPCRLVRAGSARSTPAASSTWQRTSANLEATNPNTVVVSAGDLIGASPLLSALFHDEPTIEAMNLHRPRLQRGRQPRVRRGRRRAAPHAGRRLPPGRRLPRRRRLRRGRLPASSPPTSSARTTARRSSRPTRSAASPARRSPSSASSLEGTPTIVTPVRRRRPHVPATRPTRSTRWSRS